MATAPPSAPAIVLVDDEPDILLGSSVMLRQSGMKNVRTMDDSRALLPFLAEHEVGVIVLDLQMPHLPGRELLEEITCNYPQVPVIIVTAANELDTAVECMKKGAYDYMVKPIDAGRFVASVRKALEMSALRHELDSLRECLLNRPAPNEKACAAITTRNARMKAVLGYLEIVAPTDQPVLVSGETGVGKELVARALHELSGRSGKFIAVNSAGIDEQMFSDVLFGHRKGAYTGADQDREGMIVQAAGGTLFLDEIGDLCPASQVKLLRLIQEGEYHPLGADLPVQSTARIVVATNRDLAPLMVAGSFRKDLYYRLCAHRVQVPALRERPDDIPLLLELFLEDAARALGKKKPSYPPELLHFLCSYHFPGNIRQLRAMVFDAVTRHKGGKLAMAAFREATGAASTGEEGLDAAIEEFPVLTASGRFLTLKESEELLVAAALKRANGNQRTAASLLGISRQALNKRVLKHS